MMTRCHPGYRRMRLFSIPGLALFMLSPVLAWATPENSVTTTALLERAAERHPAVATARMALEQAEALRRGEVSWPDPDLEGRLLWDGNGETELEAALRFAIPWGGRLFASRRAADLEVALARLDLATARHGAMVQAERLLARLAWARARAELHQALADRSSEQADLARRRRDASLADPLEVSLVLADAARDRRALIESNNHETSIRAELLLLAQLPPETSIEAPPLSRVPETRNREALLELARTRTPELAAARLRLEQAEERASAAKRARIPDLRLGPALTRDGGGTSWGLSVGIPLPLFGRTRAGLDAARAAHRGAEESLALERLALPVQVDLLLERLQALEHQLAELGGDTADAAEQAYRLARARWNSGKLDVLHLISAHRAFAEIRIERLDTLLQLRETWLDLSLAVGMPLDGMDDRAVTESGQ